MTKEHFWVDRSGLVYVELNDALAGIDIEGDDCDEEDAPRDTAHAVYVRNVGDNLILPEMARIKENAPTLYKQILQEGQLRLAHSMDNSSRQKFDGSTEKLEQGVFKMVFTSCGSAQQAYYHCMPGGFMQGAVHRAV
jgi:hypothetical protein